MCANFQGKGWGASTVNQEIDCLAKFLNNPKIAIDIGGNIGEYSELLKKKFSDVEIHLFEPSAVNYNKLVTRFKNNEDIIINKKAVSNKKGFSDLFSNIEGSGLSSLTKRRLEHHNIPFDVSEKVETIRFEDYWKSKLEMKEIDLIKIDVEGHELEVLEGLGSSIDKTKIIQFEFGGCNIDTHTYFQDFWYFFKDRPFKIYRITPFGIQPIRYYRESDEYFSTTNYLCVNTLLTLN